MLTQEFTALEVHSAVELRGRGARIAGMLSLRPPGEFRQIKRKGQLMSSVTKRASKNDNVKPRTVSTEKQVSKAEIIEKIQEMGLRNNGTPPGKAAFTTATGIRPSAWCGKFWARWTDALRDAGLPRNVTTRRTLTVDICAAIVGVIRDLGHFPTYAELRIRRREDANFPGRAAVARIGGKANLIQCVSDYASSHPGHKDILDVCENALAKATYLPSPDQLAKYNFVYLFRCGQLYKIGRSKQPHLRALQLDAQIPEEPVFVVHTIRTDDPVGIEAYWHGRFKDKRVQGEWFKLTTTDVRIFKSRSRM